MSNVKKLTNIKREPSLLAQKITYYMEQRGILNTAQFERDAGITPGIVRRLKSGYIQYTSPDNTDKIAKALGVSIAELAGSGAGPQAPALHPVNIAPQAAMPGWYMVNVDEMQPTFKPGDYVLIDFGAKEISGSGIYAIKIKDDSFTFRRIVYNAIKQSVFVRSDNEKYAAEGECSIDEVAVVGRVLGVFSAV